MRSCVVFALWIGAFLLAGCDQSDPEETFPLRGVALEPGAHAEYAWSFWQEEGSPPLSDRFQVEVVAVGEAVGVHDGLIHLQAVSLQDPSVVQEVWYQQDGEALVEVAYRLGASGGGPPVLPKQGIAGGTDVLLLPRTVVRRLAPQSQRLEPDTVQVRGEPRVVYRYPLEEGRTWTSFEEPFLAMREVVGEETVEVEGGRFACVKIRTRLPDVAPELVWHDYVAAQGLVLRELEDVSELRDEQNNPLGTVRTVERLELLVAPSARRP